MNPNKKTNLCSAVCVIIALLAYAVTASAKVEYGERQFDGEHKHEASAYMMVGNNVVSDEFVGLEASYIHHFTPRWYLGGDAQIQALKRLYSIDVTGGYRLPIRFGNIYFEGKGLFNRYNRWGFSEAIFNVSATWESAYVDIRLGESLIHYWSRKGAMKYGYTEPLTLTFGAGVNVRHRNNPWNIGLFFRNYDDFYFENWNINWGIRWYARINPQMRLFGEFNIRPAGSMSQLASKYEGSVKIGMKYKW